jgi:hypothetical protein
MQYYGRGRSTVQVRNEMLGDASDARVAPQPEGGREHLAATGRGSVGPQWPRSPAPPAGDVQPP